MGDWVPVYYLGNHSFDYVCVIIKTTDNSLSERFPIYNCRMIINVCITASLGNYLCLHNQYLWYLHCFFYNNFKNLNLGELFVVLLLRSSSCHIWSRKMLLLTNHKSPHWKKWRLNVSSKCIFQTKLTQFLLTCCLHTLCTDR